jgi:hypothetical protein
MTETGLTPFDFKIWRGFSKSKVRPVSRGVAVESESEYEGETVKHLSEQLEMFPDPVRRFGRRKHAERIPCCKCGMQGRV